MKPYWQNEEYDLRIYHGDWREKLPHLPASEAALAIVDGPYNMRKADWDKFASWDDFREWYRPLWGKLARVLRDNCSLYVWGTFESLAALKSDLDALGAGWAFRQVVTWEKPGYRYSSDTGRMWPVTTEHCAFYIRERVDSAALAWDGVTRADNSVRAYLNAERERAGVERVTIDKAWRAAKGGRGGMATHWFGRAQWQFPTRENYYWLRDLFNARNGGDYLTRDWEDLHREYENLRRECEALRYPFNPQVGVTDVWRAPSCVGTERAQHNGETAHPTQKPVALYERIVAASSNPGDLVIDPMAGMGTTAVACKRLGRANVSIEAQEAYCELAACRLEAEVAQGRLFDPAELDAPSAPPSRPPKTLCLDA